MRRVLDTLKDSISSPEGKRRFSVPCWTKQKTGLLGESFGDRGVSLSGVEIQILVTTSGICTTVNYVG